MSSDRETKAMAMLFTLTIGEMHFVRLVQPAHPNRPAAVL
jgi:hypothetical protein